MLRLETSKRTGIENYQDHDISDFERNWSRTLADKHPRAIPRTGLSPLYNCHGLTFASRRTKIIDSREISVILRDDCYMEVKMKEVIPGDIVIYFGNEGDANHSGIVVEYKAGYATPLICSKWGNGSEYIHGLSDCPAIYGPVTKFYRCAL